MTTTRSHSDWIARAKQLIPENSVLRAWWRRARRGPPKTMGDRILREFANAYPRAFFIQIGSNDGDHLDPLRSMILQYRWSGIMVEPVPYVFARLYQNYSSHSNRIRLENLAIADRDGHLPFYHLPQVTDYEKEGLPFWYDQLGSFRKEVVIGHAHTIPDIAQRLVATDVPCVTFDTLCARGSVKRVDLLHTDTEGYDFALLKLVDFNRFRPRVLIYEHQHLSPSDRLECNAMLAASGYEMLPDGMDTWCLNLTSLRSRDHRLTRLWEILKKERAACA